MSNVPYENKPYTAEKAAFLDILLADAKYYQLPKLVQILQSYIFTNGFNELMRLDIGGKIFIMLHF